MGEPRLDWRVLGPEGRLLCACARARQRLVDPAELEELCRLVDWDTVVRWGALHRLLPFLHVRLKGMPVPPGVRHTLGASYRATVEFNLGMLVTVIRVVEAMGASGIPVLAFKGPVAAMALYGDLGLRTFADLDLLVPAPRVAEAVELLRRVGLRPTKELDTRQMAALTRFRNELSLTVPGSRLGVDLHWALLVHHLRMVAREDSVWERAVPADVGGVTVRTLSARDSLAYFTARAAVDGWTTLSRLADIAHTLDRVAPDEVASVLEDASALGKRDMVLAGLSLAASLLDAPVPPPLLHEASQRRAVRWVTKRALGQMFTFRCRGPAGRTAVLFPLVRGWRPRLALASFLLLSPGLGDIGLLSLPPRWWWVYRVVRLTRALLAVFRPGGPR